MLNDKEKQAISKLREIIEYDKKHRLETIYDKEQIEFRNNIELVLDLIEKLQKENEELKNKVAKREKEIIELEEYANKNFERKDDVKAKYIPKDKVRDKLDEIMSYTFTSIEERHQQNYAYDRIRELLEED